LQKAIQTKVYKNSWPNNSRPYQISRDINSWKNRWRPEDTKNVRKCGENTSIINGQQLLVVTYAIPTTVFKQFLVDSPIQSVKFVQNSCPHWETATTSSW